ncbi:MAG: hypothetical protein K0S45_4364 [Nitrospira sp.]|nr:hypothetical protein [Nitrospira sp.]
MPLLQRGQVALPFGFGLGEQTTDLLPVALLHSNRLCPGLVLSVSLGRKLLPSDGLFDQLRQHVDRSRSRLSDGMPDSSQAFGNARCRSSRLSQQPITIKAHGSQPLGQLQRLMPPPLPFT